MTPAEILAQVYELCGLPSSDPVYTSAVVYRHLTSAALGLGTRLPNTLLQTYGFTVAKQALMTNSVQQIIDVHVGSQTLRKMELRQMADVNPNWRYAASTSTLTHWYEAGQTSSNRLVGLYPPPKGTLTGLVSCWRYPRDLSTNTSVNYYDLPIEWHGALSHYAAYKVLVAANNETDPNRTQQMMTEYERVRSNDAQGS